MRTTRLLLAVASAVTLLSCSTILQRGTGSITLIDGVRGLDNFNTVGGPANWTATDGAIQATQGGTQASWLQTKNHYKDFTLRVEFWTSSDANSGVYFRCNNPAFMSDTGCYEVNIFDQRPDLTYGTGAIVHTARVEPGKYKAGGQWNVYEITARGNRLTVVMNGVTTADVEDRRLANAGPIGLQWARGTIRFRKVTIRPHEIEQGTT